MNWDDAHIGLVQIDTNINMTVHIDQLSSMVEY